MQVRSVASNRSTTSIILSGAWIRRAAGAVFSTPNDNRSARSSSAYTSRVLVHGFDSTSTAAGFNSSAVCFARSCEQLASREQRFARFHAGRRVATEPLGDAQPYGTALFRRARCQACGPARVVRANFGV